MIGSKPANNGDENCCFSFFLLSFFFRIFYYLGNHFNLNFIITNQFDKKHQVSYLNLTSFFFDKKLLVSYTGNHAICWIDSLLYLIFFFPLLCSQSVLYKRNIRLDLLNCWVRLLLFKLSLLLFLVHLLITISVASW